MTKRSMNKPLTYNGGGAFHALSVYDRNGRLVYTAVQMNVAGLEAQASRATPLGGTYKIVRLD